MMEHSRQLTLIGREISYALKLSKRRSHIALSIDERGLCVRAPHGASQRHVELLLESHAGWIVTKLAEWQARRPPPFLWQTGAKIMFLGEPLQLASGVERGTTMRDGGRLYVAAASDDPATLARHVIDWLRVSALDWFTQRAVQYAAALGVAVPVVRLSNARTRWGSCHSSGRIRLNWRLIQMPAELVDYVVVHELAHLREPNHSARFWRWVSDVLPDHSVRRKTLRRTAHRYLVAQ